MAPHDVIVIGASAGGVEAIGSLVSALPRDLRAAVLVVLHLARRRSVLPDILSRVGPLKAVHPTDGEHLQYGRIYVAPPDLHMTIRGQHVRVHHGPSENGVRPAIDPLFRSAARTYGPRVIGVVLTGSLDDGTAGLAVVKAAGGITIVQDPTEAFSPSMPRSAMAHVQVDHVLPLREIPVLLATLTREKTASPGSGGPHLREMEPDRAEMGIALDGSDRPGKVSVFTCPECHGSLWEEDDERLLLFRCRVGHVYSQDSMIAAQSDSVDRALWFALRSLEERVALTRRMARRARDGKYESVARAFEERALVAEQHAAVVRSLIVQRDAQQTVPDHAEGPVPPAGIVTSEAKLD